MDDPSGSINKQLLQHLHLVFSHKFALLSQIALDTVVEILSNAPRHVRDIATASWQLLEAPRDGTAYLIWQSPSIDKQQFATDGYIYGDNEQYYSQRHKGYLIEMFMHTAGFRPGHETMACHSRRRYRMSSTPETPPNMAMPDPNIWLVHWAKSDPQHQYEAFQLQPTQAQKTMLTQRAFLHRSGQIVQKDFRLDDRANWPRIDLPQQAGTPQQPQRAMPPPQNLINQLGRSMQQPYVAGQQVIDQRSPGKGQVPGPTAHRGSIAKPPIDPLFDEDEDTAARDLLDFITPRDISTMRFKQHQEWMEEIFASHFSMSQIVPTSLGLGRKGALASLTENVFDAPMTPDDRVPVAPTDPTRREASQAGSSSVKPEANPEAYQQKIKDFTSRAEAKIDSVRSEIARMKLRHSKRMERLRGPSAFMESEKELRALGVQPKGTAWASVETSAEAHDPAKGDITVAFLRQLEKVDTIGRQMEEKTKRKIELVQDYKLVAKGGLETKVSTPFIPPDDEISDFAANFGIDSMFTDMMDTDMGGQEGNVDGTTETNPPPAASTVADEKPQAPSELQKQPTPPNQDASDWVMVENPTAEAEPAASIENTQQDVEMFGDEPTVSTEPTSVADLPKTDGQVVAIPPTEPPPPADAPAQPFKSDIPLEPVKLGESASSATPAAGQIPGTPTTENPPTAAQSKPSVAPIPATAHLNLEGVPGPSREPSPTASMQPLPSIAGSVPPSAPAPVIDAVKEQQPEIVQGGPATGAALAPAEGNEGLIEQGAEGQSVSVQQTGMGPGANEANEQI